MEEFKENYFALTDNEKRDLLRVLRLFREAVLAVNDTELLNRADEP